MLLNDGSTEAPKLRVYLNLDNLVGLRADSRGPGPDAPDRNARLAADGFEGLQLTSTVPDPGRPALPFCGTGRLDLPTEADLLVKRHQDRGDQCLTLHVGRGLEDDDVVYRLVEALLTSSEKHRFPVFVETHRATITQDLWRTVRLAQKFPELRFNADFSHYYCGQEMVYGDWRAKLEFMRPIFDGVAFLHGRVASSGNMQMPVPTDWTKRDPADLPDYVGHFRDLWTHAMAGFLRRAKDGDVLIFAPELLGGIHSYARRFPDASGALIEETDRYAQALVLRDFARDCFSAALQTRD